MRVVKIGRNPNNDIVINDPAVSMCHCQITQDDNGAYYISDLNSTNGTYINGTLILNPNTPLQVTDEVRIGNTRLPWMDYFTANYSGNNMGVPPVNPAFQTPPPTPQYASAPNNMPYPPTPPMDKPKNHLGASIAFTILCCWPFGIPAIVNAAKVDRLWNNGYYEEARRASRKAKSWMWTSFVLGLVFGILYLLYYVLVIGAGVLSEPDFFYY